MKKLFSIVLVCAMVLSLCACGSSSSGSGAATSTAAASTAAASTAAASEKSEAAAPAAADGEVYELIVQNHDPSTSICAQFIEAWGSEIEEESGGRNKFIYYPGGSLGGATETVDMVLNGQADIGWTSASINVGRFPCSDGIALPMLGFDTTVQAAQAMWNMYETHDYISDEWKDFYVIEVAAACDVPFTTTKKKIETPDDFKGLRMRAVVPGVVYMLNELGCVPMSITISDTYENLEKSVADGCMNDWHNIMAFSLWDVLKYAMDCKVSFSNQALIMNKDKYNSLPDDLKAIIDAHSGEYAALMAGEYWDSSIEKSKEVAASQNVEIYEATPEVQAALDAAGEVAWSEWAADMDAAGYDGQQVVDDYLAAMSEVMGS